MWPLWPWGDTIVRFWNRSRPEQTRPRLECRTRVSSTSISCQTLSQGLSKSLCAHPSATIGGAICSDNTLGGIVRATFDGKNRLLLWGFHVFDLNVITTPTIINVEEPFLLNLVTFFWTFIILFCPAHCLLNKAIDHYANSVKLAPNV